MGVWCIVKGHAKRPYKFISIRKLAYEMFDEVGGFSLKIGDEWDEFEFTFCDDGLSAAMQVDKFVAVLRDNRIRVDIITEIRFLT